MSPSSKSFPSSHSEPRGYVRIELSFAAVRLPGMGPDGDLNPVLLLHSNRSSFVPATHHAASSPTAPHSHPILVTETIRDSHSPTWTSTAVITVDAPLSRGARAEERDAGDVKFVATIVDDDGNGPSEDGLVGRVEFCLLDLFKAATTRTAEVGSAAFFGSGSWRGRVALPLEGGGMLTVTAAASAVDPKSSAIVLRFGGMEAAPSSLPAAESYFRLSRIFPGGAVRHLYQSEVVVSEPSCNPPVWRPCPPLLAADLVEVASPGSPTLKLELFECNRIAADVTCSLQDLMELAESRASPILIASASAASSPVARRAASPKAAGSCGAVRVINASSSTLEESCRAAFGLPVTTPRYHNWSYELDLGNMPVASPTDADEVASLCNWCAEHGHCVRAIGSRLSWAPLTVGHKDATDAKFVLLDMLKMNHVSVDASRTRFPFPVVHAQPGVMMIDLLDALHRTPNDDTPPGEPNIGYYFPNVPGVAEVTLGGVLAINGHGTSLDVPGQPAAFSGHGTMSSRIVQFTAICFDDADDMYKPKVFVRGACGGEDSAFLVSLGRTVLVEVVLRLERNVHLHCRSTMDTHSSTLFATPTPSCPVPRGSVQELLNQTGRLEVIYYPHLPDAEDYPWVHTWEAVERQPSGSHAVTGFVPYHFMAHLPRFITVAMKLLLGHRTGPNEVRHASRELQRALLGREFSIITFVMHAVHRVLWCAWAVAAFLIDKLSCGYVDVRSSTPMLLRVFQFVTQFQFSRARSPCIGDIWGPSHTSLVYVTTSTLRATANGYAVILNRRDVQRAVHFFTATLRGILDEMAATRNLHPLNAAMEIRVTGLDKGQDCGMPNAEAPYLSAASWDPDCDAYGWDCVLWLNALTMPTSEGVSECFTRLEAELCGYRFFQPPYGRLRPEIAKGWGYTHAGPYTNAAFMDYTRRQLPQFAKARAILEKYDPKGLFTNSFLQDFFDRASLPQHESAAGHAVRRREVAERREQYRWERQCDAADGPEWGPPQVAGYPVAERNGFWAVFPGGPEGLKTIIRTSLKALIPSLLFAARSLRPLKLSDFEDLYRFFGGHALMDKWRRDDVWTRMQLHGLNPTLFRRGELADFTADRLNASQLSLPDGMDLESAIDNGHVFVIDYRSYLECGATRENCAAAPLVAFFTTQRSLLDMEPVAVQLFAGGPVYTPLDAAGNQWLMAKMFCQCANGNLQDAVFHNMRTHWVPEAVYVACKRQLSERHPIMQVVQPHAWGLININNVTRSNLRLGAKGPLAARSLGLDGGYKAVCARAWAQFSWDDLDVCKDISQRGVYGLADYAWKDDATELWALELEYAQRLVDCFYDTDADVAEDTELIGLAMELTEVCGFRGSLWSTGRLETREKLAQFLGTFIYVCTAGHATYNNSTWDVAGYLPLQANSFRLLPPLTKVHVSEDTLARALPHTPIELLVAINTPAIVDVPEPTHPASDIFVAQPGYLSSFPEARAVALAHRDELRAFSNAVKARNRERRHAYSLLDPDSIAQSVNL